MQPAQIGKIVKAAAARIGLPESEVSAHSLRASFVTIALSRGISECLIANQTGHKSLATLRLYLRPSNLFEANASASLGL